MDPFEANMHSFVVKVWLEEAGEGDGPPIWRGHITHVPSNQRRYVKDLEGIADFISLYLEKMGVQIEERRWDAGPWLKGRVV